MTKFLLDTCALSEPLKPSPNKGFMDWFGTVDELSLCTSCINLGEVQKGASLQSDIHLRKQLEVWLAGLEGEFKERIVSVGPEVAMLWGQLTAVGQQAGKTPPAVDALIAAQCLHHGLTLITRNVRDFEQFAGLKVLCPWSGA